LAKNVHEKQKLSPLVTLAKNDQAKISPLVPWPKMTKINQNFHYWYRWPKMTKKNKTFTVGNLGQK